MGNGFSHTTSFENLSAENSATIFSTLDCKSNGFLSLKDLMSAVSPGVIMPHSLPALYFVDMEKNGRWTLAQFTELIDLFQVEKLKAEENVCLDREFRDVISRASAAGVKDCSVPCRTSFRRFYSFSNVSSLYQRGESGDSPAGGAGGSGYGRPNVLSAEGISLPPAPVSPSSASPSSPRPPNFPRSNPSNANAENDYSNVMSFEPVSPSARVFDTASSSTSSSSPASSSPRPAGEIGNDGASSLLPSVDTDADVEFHDGPHYVHSAPDFGDDDIGGGDIGGGGSSSSGDSDTNDSGDSSDSVSSARDETEDSVPAPHSPPRLEPLAADLATAIDAAVMESVSRTHIHKLVDVLTHHEGAREQFMQWLWNLVDYNCNGIITLEELRVFLQALNEDGINLEELAFYKESGVPLDECIINEFDTTQSGGLEQDEFMVLADLVTREYEYWENRHLDCIGNYELGRTVGRGSSGVVRMGVNVLTQEKYAVKIVRKGKCADMNIIDREIKALQVGKHERIVDLEQVLETEANVFLVLGLCGGGSLAHVVRLYPEQRMPERVARFYLRQILEGLSHCHQKGICHRDVRLDNILLDNAGLVKITDFGHSKMFTSGWDWHSSTLVGSIYNLSPEQIAGAVYSGEKIDIWSTGVAIFTLLVGRPPFHDADSVQLLENITLAAFTTPDFISEEAADLIRCMIRVSPEERLSLSQLLHHPWFYADVAQCPKMGVYRIAVDCFFKRRPDLAEMIMAGTIHEHNLHFHLADISNPTSSPEDLRGQDWSLKCLSPQMNMKFAVSLFSSPPDLRMQTRLDSNSRDGLPSTTSYSELPSPRASCQNAAQQEVYRMFDDDSDAAGSPPPDSKLGLSSPLPYHKRSKSLDYVRGDSDAWLTDEDFKSNSTLAVDAFPCRKNLPRKEMPEATRVFDSDLQIAAAAAAAAKSTNLHRSVTMEGVPSGVLRHRAVTASRSISKTLALHPSKAYSLSVPADEPVRVSPEAPPVSADFVPFIEVRLQRGECGLFLRICHKLKTICETKLVEAAESQRQRSMGRKTASASISAFRKTSTAQ